MTPQSNPAPLADQAVGSTPESHAQWLLKFSQQDFQNLGPDEVRRLQFEFAAFLSLDLHLRTRDGGLAPQQLPTTTAVRQWQSGLKRVLGSLTRGQEWITVSARLQIALRFSTGRLVVNKIITPLHEADRFMLKAVETLANVQVRQCAREDCKRLFIGTEKLGRPQDYCSSTCRGTVGKRRYRHHHS